MMSPDNIRIINHKKAMDAFRQTKEYRDASDAWLVEHPFCEMWLREGIQVKSVLVHHPYKWSYLTTALYIDFKNNGAMAVSSAGHFACHHGLKVCPVCKKNWCPAERDMCKLCWERANPELAEKLVFIREQMKRDINKRRRESRAEFKKKLAQKSGENSGK